MAVLQTSMTSALYHIFYYECSIQLNIYNWFLSDLLDVHSVKCMKKKTVCQFQYVSNQGFTCLEENESRIADLFCISDILVLLDLQ